MSKRIAILFSGQGAQQVGMGKDLVERFPTAKSLYEQADEVLGLPLSKVMLEGPDETLTRTSYCQPALYLHGITSFRLLQEQLPDLEISAAAGLSLGEFTAHSAAGTFSFEEGLKIVAQRGQFMEESCEATEGAMAAMIGGKPEDVKLLASESGVNVANFNAHGQIVLSGSIEGIDKAIGNAKSKGVKMAKKLKVAGAYHSPLMQSAQNKLAEVLSKQSFQVSLFPVYANYTARVTTPQTLTEVLEKQVTGSVRWTESMESLIAEGITTFIELGPGKVLAGLMARIDKTVKVISVSDAESLKLAVEELQNS